ncbi:MAG: methionyl-tRNA formyltransferase [Desulfarculus sp.]|nr:methionyl-tRNA formyltransferase [Desulfarculus sp.]
MSESLGNSTTSGHSSLDLVFLGTPDIAVPSLEALVRAGHRVRLVVTQPDRPAGRGRKLTRCAVALAADALGLTVSQPQKVGSIAQEIAALAPDALAVLAFGQMLPAPVLAAGRLGAINVHTSLLPALRGAAPISRAVMQGLTQTGVSTMFMDLGMDTGDVIFQEAVEIGPQETAGQLTGRLAVLGANLLLRTLAALAQGQAPRLPQDPGQATLAPRLSKAEGLVDWSRPARELDWQVRGCDPWPGAYTLLEGQPLKLFAPTLVLAEDSGAAPGTVPGSWLPPRPGLEDWLLVATGLGVLGLGQAQAAGKKRLAAREFLRGLGRGPLPRLGL